LRILIASGLRKGATLHYWIALAEHNPPLIVDELLAVLTSGDRDKSDAGSNVAELAAFYADDPTLRKLIEGLQASDYKHFREAAEAWHGRIKAQHDLFRRIKGATHQGAPLHTRTQDELEEHATELASLLAKQSNSSLARKLSTVNRLIWARRTGRASSLNGITTKK
jgi:hypothetical protein